MADPGNNFNTALNIGNLSSLLTYQDFVGTVDRSDFYRFNLTQNSNVNLQLSGLSEYAYVRLVADLNNNGLYDSSEVLYEDYGYSSSTGDINQTLGTGSYFALVEPYYSTGNTDYTLSLSATAAPLTTPSNPGNNLNTALNIGNLSSSLNYQDFVGTVDRSDVYRFNLTQNSDVSLQLSGLSDYAYVRLVADLNNNGLYDSGEILYDDYGYSSSTADINESLGTGSYFAWVESYNPTDNTNYTLSLSATASPVTTPSNPGNNLNTALNIGNLSNLLTYQDFVGTVDRSDVYRFNLTQNSNVSLQLSGLSDYAYVRLVADLNNNGLYDSGEILYDDYGYSSSTGDINEALGTGSYFAWIESYNPTDNTNYTLSLSATASPVTTPSNPGNNLNTALNIGNLGSLLTYQDFVGTVDRADVYRFNLTQNSNVGLQLSGLSDYAYVRLVADLNNNGLYDSGEILYDDYSSSGSTADINESLGAGSYFAWVESYYANSNTNYTLSLSATASPVTTPNNPGNNLNTALNIGNLSSPLTYQDFVGSLDRSDVYRFNLTQNSNVNLKLSGLSDYAYVRLVADLNNNGLYDSGEILYSDYGYSSSTGDINEALGTGNYFAWVESYYTTSNTNYTLSLSATVSTPSNNDDYILGDSNDNTIDGLGGNDRLESYSGNDSLAGGSGNDSLWGGSGDDTMIGGTGNDHYEVDSTGDVISETSTIATEIDLVQASITYTLGANLENLTLTGGNTINGTGNSLHNLLTGNDANNSLSGGGGRDTLIGGLGNDTMIGWTGNDIYEVDGTGDVVSETSTVATEIDAVRTSITYTLGANLENLTLTGTSGINGTGNTLNNTIIGNDANNSLIGGGGNDSLVGGAGNDAINGSTGDDTMIGGIGNDVYGVDSLGDVVSETSTVPTEIDTVRTSITYTLGANLENLTLTGTTAINGTGNTLNNSVIGNDANNSLNGGAGNDSLVGGAGNDYLLGWTGNDTMIGGLGNDIYVVDTLGDVIAENSAVSTEIDTVRTSITYTLGANLENLTLNSTSGINGTGNTLNNTLIGNDGNNILKGGSGNDILTGGAGSDRFSFSSKSEGIDRINDFSTIDDTINVSASGFGGGLVANSSITVEQFHLGAAAHDSSDRFIYDSSNGALYFDLDGTGSSAMTQIATLSTGLAMTNADILVDS